MAKGLKAICAFLLMLLFANTSIAQLTQYAIGGPGNEIATKVKHLTSDGSTIIGGYTYDVSNGAAINCQCILMKISSTGTIVWQKTFGVANADNVIEDMIVTADNNIVVVGVVGGSGALYSDNTAAILKFNSTNGSLMWQQCFRDANTTPGGELFYGIAELTDGTGRLVAVGAHNFTNDGAGSMVCVFQSNGTLIYNEVHDIGNGDEFRSVTPSSDGASVYICGEFVGDFKDGKIIKYTPGTTSGVVDWTQCIDYYALGTMQNNFFTNIQLSNNILIIVTGNGINYTYNQGQVNGIVTMSAIDGSGVSVKAIQNSNATFGNDCAIAAVSNDHIFIAQEPANVSLGDAIATPGTVASSVITDITSLSSGTTNPPVKFISSETGEHSVLSLDLLGSNTLLLTGGTNVASGFGNNDIYYVQTNTSLASLNHNCDTAHDVISITNLTYTTSAPTYTLFSFTPTYSTVDTGSTNFNIGVLCGDAVDTTCNTVSLPDSASGCKGTNVNLNGIISGSDTVLNIHWSPATGLSDTDITNPVLTLTNSGWYSLTVKSIIPNNLVNNGDFSQGNTGFTSAYLYAATPPPPGTASIQDHYSIGTNPYAYNNAWPSIGDHTSGTGNMLIIDADTIAPPSSLWCQTISVTPNTDYVFSIWSALLYPPLPSLQATINGVNIGTFSTVATVGQWTRYRVMWNSGNNTSADICLFDLNMQGFGNDFAIDDISFQPICIATDSIYALAEAGDTAYKSTDTGLCSSNAAYTLTAPAGYNSVLWNTGETTATINISSSGTYWVSETNSCNGLLVDTFHITKLPSVNITATGDTTVCRGEKAPLGASGGISYLWSPANNLNSATVSNPIATPDTTTIYIVTGKDSVGCTGLDTITVTILSAPTLKIDSPQIADCTNRSIQLNATGATKYRWEPAAYFNNPDIANPIVTPTVSTTFYLTGYNAAGCFSTDSVQVIVEEQGDIVMPNAFTPNGDGKNDAIFPLIYCDFTFESFSVYNRWGQRVFFTNEYMNGWDGTFNGVQQPLGVFVYYVTGYKTSTKEHVLRKGNITLIR